MINELKKIRNYIQAEINPYGKPFEGSVYDFGIKVMKYIDAVAENRADVPDTDAVDMKCKYVAVNCGHDCKDCWKFDLIKPRWIPCSERLPNNNEYDWVLAQAQEDNGNLWIPRVMEYRESKDDWYLEDENPCWLKECHGDAFKVIAWMPLPEPYKESEEQHGTL